MKKLYDGLYSTDCNLDLEKLKSSCLKIEDIVTQFPTDPRWVDNKNHKNPPATVRTISSYNFLTFPYPQIHNLYKAIQNFFYQVEKSEYGNNGERNYYILSWLNVYHENESLDWHTHTYNTPRAWHGFFCVDTEPSNTLYKFANQSHLSVECKNNSMVIALSENNYHKTEKWLDKTKPRITVAFDIIPEQGLREVKPNRWIPL